MYECFRYFLLCRNPRSVLFEVYAVPFWMGDPAVRHDAPSGQVANACGAGAEGALWALAAG